MRRLRIAAVLAVAVGTAVAVLVAPAAAETPPQTPPGTAPLAAPVWLCKPGLPGNLCGQDAAGNPAGPVHYPDGAAVDIDTTQVAADGSTRVVALPRVANPPVDCFYVYPTIDIVANPPLQIGSLPPAPRDEELAVMLAQAGQLSGQCRMFAPVYRQDTLLALGVSLLLGNGGFHGPGFADVQQAFTDYWTHDNVDPATGKRRGIVFVGHSQGSAALSTLMQNLVDGRPEVQRQLVSAVLLGGGVQVPVQGAPGPGSTFQHIPACTRPTPAAPVPTGCVVAFSSYMATAGSAPAANGLARNTAPGQRTLCTNPAALLTGTDPGASGPLQTAMPTRTLVRGNALNPNGHLAVPLFGLSLTTYPTGFAGYSGLLRGHCAFTGDATTNQSWFQVDNGTALFPASTSTAAIGLHVADYSVAFGDLSRLVAAQAAAWPAPTG